MKAMRLFLLAGLLAVAASPGRAADKLKLAFDHYYSGPEVVETLQKLHKAWPEITELRSLGKSEEGRDIWELTINNPKTGPDTEKPGIYVDGTIHGNEIQATEVALYTAWYLLYNYDSIPKITELVDHRAFYVVPVVNVDGRWRFFADPGSYNIGRSAIVPYDDDRDGLADEDGYEDLDGDGEIMLMRKADPFGEYRTSPDDPRVMIRTKPGEQGEWTLLGREGIDNDGDGDLNEDPPGYLDMNRNWGFKWQPPYVQDGAGDFPMSSKPARAIADFVLSKPNIVFDFAFHNYGGLFVRGPGSNLAGFYPPGDVKVYDYLGHEGEKIVPGYKYIIGSKDMYTTHGDFDEWLYSGLGIYGFVGELFKQDQLHFGNKEGRVTDVEEQKFNDRLAQGTMFKEWTGFDHPQFGKIELGGWRTFTTRIPPAFMLQEMAHRNASMVIFTAGEAPEISLSELDVKHLGDGLHRIRIRAANRHAIPSLSGRAVREQIVREDLLTITGRNIEVVSGGIVDDLYLDNVEAAEHRPEVLFVHVPSFGKTDVQWIVRGSGKVKVSYNALKAANQTLTVDLDQ